MGRDWPDWHTVLFCLLLGPLGFAAGMALTWNMDGADLSLPETSTNNTA